VLDHDHSTHLVRAVLCQSCNTRLGKVERGRRAPKGHERQYLESFGSTIPELMLAKEDEQRFQLRLSASLYETVQRLAARERSSMNQEIMRAIERHVERQNGDTERDDND
jgi:predicted HicB family RNase H-like nuclease